jgi:hypothetical protein
MKISTEFQNIIRQSLLDSYGINYTSMENDENIYYTRYELKGHLDNVNFGGSLNIACNKGNDYSFNITGFFDGNTRKFMDYILTNNQYSNAVKEIDDFVSEHFDRNLRTIYNRFHIAMGDFSFDGKSFSNIKINATPAFAVSLDIAPKQEDQIIDNSLIDIFYGVEEGKEQLSCRTKRFYDSANNLSDLGSDLFYGLDLDTFRKLLIREYMFSYSALTEIPIILKPEEFISLSYEHLLDYLTVQRMNDI